MDTPEDIKILVESGYPDIRRVINSAQRNVVNGKLKLDTTSIIQNDYKLKLVKMIKRIHFTKSTFASVPNYSQF